MLWYFKFDFYFYPFRLGPSRLIPCSTLLPTSTLGWVYWFLHPFSSWVRPPHSSLKTLEFREQIRDHWGVTRAFKNMHFICNKIVLNIKSIDCTWLLRNIQRTSLSKNIKITSYHQTDVGDLAFPKASSCVLGTTPSSPFHEGLYFASRITCLVFSLSLCFHHSLLLFKSNNLFCIYYKRNKQSTQNIICLHFH